MYAMNDAATISVHRCRFVDFTPASITAIAFPPLPLPKVGRIRKPSAQSENRQRFGALVLGRSNGNIELCQWSGGEQQMQSPRGWSVIQVLAGTTSSKIEALALSIRKPHLVQEDSAPNDPNLRLFSVGGSSKLIEWDLSSGIILRTLDSEGGAVWSMAVNPACTFLALGCEDGSIKLVSVEDDALIHHRHFDKVKCRLLSLAWGPPILQRMTSSLDDMDEDDGDFEEQFKWEDSYLISGNSDSSLRKWDVKTGRVINRMTVDRMRNDRTLVWTVGVLGDGVLVSGDSLGVVKFWDSMTCTQIQSFQAHSADVLCLVIGPEGETIFTSGVDQKTTIFSCIKMSERKEDKGEFLRRQHANRWVQSTFRRMHAHDVRGLAIWPPYRPLPDRYQKKFNSGISPILVSAGLDMSIVLTPCAPASNTSAQLLNPLGTSLFCNFEDAYYHKMAYTSALYPVLHCARQARLIMCVRDNSVSLWRISERPAPSDFDYKDNERSFPKKEDGYEKLFELDIMAHTNLLKGAISNDGKWMAISDHYDVKLFALDKRLNDNRIIKPRKIKNFSAMIKAHFRQEASLGASSLGFSPDSTKLILGMFTTAYVVIVDLTDVEGNFQILRYFDRHRSAQVLMQDSAMNISRVVESDNEVIGEEIADVNAMVSALAFSPDGQWLATTDSNCQTYVYNLDAMQYHCVIPTLAQRVHALAFDPSSPALLMMAFANNSIQVYDVENKNYPLWSQKLNDMLPRRYKLLPDSILGIVFRSLSATSSPIEGYAILWGSTWLCKIKLKLAGDDGTNKKRRRHKVGDEIIPNANATRNQEQEGLDFKIITEYRPILLVDFLASDELLVVERPLLDVLTRLPPAYFKPKYGS